MHTLSHHTDIKECLNLLGINLVNGDTGISLEFLAGVCPSLL
jgi:hypothetical protein